MAESSRDKAEKELREAIALKNNINEKIYKSVENEKTKLLKATDKELQYSKLKHLGTVGSLSVGLVIYCAIITILWLTDHSEPLKTIPLWFAARIENLKYIWGLITSLYLWGYNLLNPHTNDLVAKGVSFIITTAITCLIAYGLFKLITWIWFDYIVTDVSYDKELLYLSSTIAIIIVSIPLAMFLVEVIPLSINVVSWWLLLSFGLNVAYQKITNKLS